MKQQLKSIRRLLLLFMVCLFLSGLTAIPLAPELTLLLQIVPEGTMLCHWLNRVLAAYLEVEAKHPFLLYGYDWLAYAHFILTVLFIGPYRNPVQNIWVLEFGMIACAGVFPLAFIAGYFRGIPFGWQLIDCSFGLLGVIPLLICYQKTKQLIQHTSSNQAYDIQCNPIPR